MTYSTATSLVRRRVSAPAPMHAQLNSQLVDPNNNEQAPREARTWRWRPWRPPSTELGHDGSTRCVRPKLMPLTRSPAGDGSTAMERTAHRCDPLAPALGGGGRALDALRPGDGPPPPLQSSMPTWPLPCPCPGLPPIPLLPTTWPTPVRKVGEQGPATQMRAPSSGGAPDLAVSCASNPHLHHSSHPNLLIQSPCSLTSPPPRGRLAVVPPDQQTPAPPPTPVEL